MEKRKSAKEQAKIYKTLHRSILSNTNHTNTRDWTSSDMEIVLDIIIRK